jgi:hypothetical protein
MLQQGQVSDALDMMSAGSEKTSNGKRGKEGVDSVRVTINNQSPVTIILEARTDLAEQFPVWERKWLLN